MKIFAFGSNMCTARLRARVRSAQPLGIAALAGHTLRFHKRGWRDGSGKCDAFARGDGGGCIWGVVFRIDPAEKPALDRIEGLGRGYDSVRIHVTGPDGRTHGVWMYRADAAAIDPSVLPFAWYRDLVLAGALEHGLPDDYVRRHIAATDVCADPDAGRRHRHRSLITPQYA